MLTHNLKNFISEYTKIPYLAIDPTKQSYSVEFTFDNFRTNLVINQNKDGYVLSIINELSESSPCLELYVFEKENIIQAEIKWIRAITRGCQIPSSSAGTWILKLVDALTAILGIQKVELSDIAKITCGQDETSLKMLRIYGGGRSWYEKFGYHLDTEYQTAYDQAILNLINLPMSLVVQNVENFVIPEDLPLVEIGETLEELQPKVLQIFEMVPIDNYNLGSYLTDLWQRSCHHYLILEQFLQFSSLVDMTFALVQSTKLYRE